MTDVLLVSLGSTAGLRFADAELAASLERAGASVAVTRTEPPREVRTMALTDRAWARAAAAAAKAGIAEHSPRAIIYSSVGAALLWPQPGAIRFDAPAAGNRPGHHGVWQRPTERRRFAQSPLLIPWSPGGLEELPGMARDTPAIVVPVPTAPSGPIAGERDIAAVTYGANPEKKGLAHVLAAWKSTRREGEELVVLGAPEAARTDAEGVRWTGLLEPDEYRAVLRRARVFVTCPAREDYGIAQLDALVDGCMLVTTEAPGPYAALPIARAADERLVGHDLAGALRTALDYPKPNYAELAADGLRAYSPEQADRVVAEELLPALVG